MSKKLEKKASKLARRAEDHAINIRRVVREYSTAFQGTPGATLVNRNGELEIERAVFKYNEVHKALKRLRKRIAIKGKQDQSSRIRAVKFSKAG